MELTKKDMLLYAVTDRSWIGDSTLSTQVEEALKGGATFIQLREKNLDFESFVRVAKSIRELTLRYSVPFVVNDNIDVAIACGADGIHLGQDDIEVPKARAILGPDKIIGVTVHNIEQAKKAAAEGANYLGAGSIFSTSTKPEACLMPFHRLKEICHTVNIPVVAIGGINMTNVLPLSGTGISGIAAVSGIFSHRDIVSATAEFRLIAEKVVNSYD